MMLQACLNLLACRKSFAMLLSNIFSWTNNAFSLSFLHYNWLVNSCSELLMGFEPRTFDTRPKYVQYEHEQKKRIALNYF